MRKILAKVDHIRASGMATLDLRKEHPLYHLDGKRYPVESMGMPDIKCRVTLLIDGEKVDLTIDDLY